MESVAITAKANSGSGNLVASSATIGHDKT